MKNFLKSIALVTSLATLLVSTGCVNSSSDFKTQKDIEVVSREDGSGTRGAFIELFAIQKKNDDGSKKDYTTKEAIIAKQTDILMTTVAGNKYSIGYISMGSLNDTIKAVKIDGAEPTAENVKNKSYTISRPFNIATKGEPTGLAKDFIDFIFSADGQKIVAKSYIPVSDAPAYSGDMTSGKIVIAGSSSISPLMEKLIEGYKKINANAEIELQANDSSSGMRSTIDGSSDIGMASRDLKDSEKEKLNSMAIALDGIVVIVNKNNPIENLSKQDVEEIFTGKVLKWSDLINE